MDGRGFRSCEKPRESGNGCMVGIRDGAAWTEACNQGRAVVLLWPPAPVAVGEALRGSQKGAIESRSEVLSIVKILPMVPYGPVIFIFALLSLD